MPRGFNPSRRSYPLPIAVSNSISNTPQGGGNKLQGLPPSIDIPSNLNRPCCLNKAWNPPEERTKIVCMNTLSGVGRGRSQFNPSADGINCLVEDCCEQYIKSLYQDPNFRSCLDLTAIYLPLPSLEYTASQCVVDLFVSWGGPVMWVLPQGFRYTGTNVLSTRTSPTGHWGNFNFLLSVSEYSMPNSFYILKDLLNNLTGLYAPPLILDNLDLKFAPLLPLDLLVL